MSNVSMELVKQLRDKTQVGMMDCKKALEEANGDFDQAVEILRKRGAAVAAKRADNVTNQGKIESNISADNKSGSLVEVACETDFSANTDAMKQFIADIAEHLVATTAIAADAEALLKQQLSKKSSITVQQHLDELVSKICEKIKINRFVRFQVASHGLVNAYIHPGASVGVMIEIATDKDAASATEALKALTREICMQVAVTNPVSVSPDQLDPQTLEKERALAREMLKDSGKPAQVIDKIIEGKMGKFYQDACLLNQPFIKNDKITVGGHIEEVGKKLGLTITVKQFKRFAIGR